MVTYKYRLYADGRVVFEDDFDEDNQRLDAGGSDDYKEYDIPACVWDDCASMRNAPIIPTATEGFAEVFYNNKKIGEISTSVQLMEIRAQIKENPNYVNECFIRWIDEENIKWDLYIEPGGFFEIWPKGFFDKFDILLEKLI